MTQGFMGLLFTSEHILLHFGILGLVCFHVENPGLPNRVCFDTDSRVTRESNSVLEQILNKWLILLNTAVVL